MADDTSNMLNYAGQGMMAAGAGLAGFSIVGDAIPSDLHGIPT